MRDPRGVTEHIRLHAHIGDVLPINDELTIHVWRHENIAVVLKTHPRPSEYRLKADVWRSIDPSR